MINTALCEFPEELESLASAGLSVRVDYRNRRVEIREPSIEGMSIDAVMDRRVGALTHAIVWVAKHFEVRFVYESEWTT